MLITVAVCTRNRARSLDRTLRSIVADGAPAGVAWEILVVDNGSTDETASVVQALSSEWDRLRMVGEPEAGLSRARNRAVREARGRYIVWTDDDVLIAPGRLAAYLSAFEEYPEYTFFGGPIRARLEGDPPAWLLRVLDRVPGAFGVRDLGPTSQPLGPGSQRLPFGANYAVRMDVQRSYLYDPALGVKPGPFVRGEETAVLAAMIRGGEQGRWVPGAEVTHIVPPSAQNERHVRSFYRLDAATRREESGVGRRRLFLRALHAETRFRVLRRLAPPERWIEALVTASDRWGAWDGAARSGKAT